MRTAATVFAMGAGYQVILVVFAAAALGSPLGIRLEAVIGSIVLGLAFAGVLGFSLGGRAGRAFGRRVEAGAARAVARRWAVAAWALSWGIAVALVGLVLATRGASSLEDWVGASLSSTVGVGGVAGAAVVLFGKLTEPLVILTGARFGSTIAVRRLPETAGGPVPTGPTTMYAPEASGGAAGPHRDPRGGGSVNSPQPSGPAIEAPVGARMPAGFEAPARMAGTPELGAASGFRLPELPGQGSAAPRAPVSLTGDVGFQMPGQAVAPGAPRPAIRSRPSPASTAASPPGAPPSEPKSESASISGYEATVLAGPQEVPRPGAEPKAAPGEHHRHHPLFPPLDPNAVPRTSPEPNARSTATPSSVTPETGESS